MEFWLNEFAAFWTYYTANVAAFYEKSLQDPLFNGSLTLGAFLLSLETYIVLKLKEDIFDSERWRAQVRNLRKYGGGISYYGPLKNISNLLYYAVMLFFTSATLQFTAGFYPHWSAATICIVSFGSALGFLVWALIIIKQNLAIWIKALEDEAEAQEGAGATP